MKRCQEMETIRIYKWGPDKDHRTRDVRHNLHQIKILLANLEKNNTSIYIYFKKYLDILDKTPKYTIESKEKDYTIFKFKKIYIHNCLSIKQERLIKYLLT